MRLADYFKTRRRLANERDWAYLQVGVWRDAMDVVDSDAIKKLLASFRDPPRVVHFEGDGSKLEMTVSDYGAALMARCFAHQLEISQAPNFLTMSFFDGRCGPIEVTIRRHLGDAPAEQIAKLKAEIATLKGVA